MSVSKIYTVVRQVRTIYSIAIVEDDPVIKDELAKLLATNGYRVFFPKNFDSVSSEIVEMKPDLILLDINLPGNDGFTICTDIRCHSQVPIIFVTGRKSDIDELSGIALGGDDFITKPYNPAILLVRISRILQRYTADSDNRQLLKHKNVSLDVLAGRITYKDLYADLTKTETKIMFVLFSNCGNITPKEKIIDTLWNNSMFLDDNALSVNITRIREKLTTIGLNDFIVTKRGRGYII